MTKTAANPDKTIVCSFDDTTRMLDFCKENGVISKDFYDWYLMEPTFFAESGILIINMKENGEHKVAVSFDFSNPDEVAFIWYSYKRQLPICKFYFNRQQNLTMEDICYDVEYESLKLLEEDAEIYFPPEDRYALVRTAKKLRKLKSMNAKGKRNIMIENETKLVDIKLQELMPNCLDRMCEKIIYSTYAMMYYVSKQQPEEITTAFNAETNTGEKIKSIYKYTGYVDLRKNKVYRPLIKKDPNSPVREYQRHIQKWIVRGHYRNIGGNKKWIAEHTKGDGELEKRIYSTEDEKDLNLIPKVFEVERRVVSSETEQVDDASYKSMGERNKYKNDSWTVVMEAEVVMEKPINEIIAPNPISKPTSVIEDKNGHVRRIINGLMSLLQFWK